jgi:RHS repeat-associated protein
VYKFNGKELDESTGYYYYGARYYDPAISIFLSVDPLAEQFPNFTPYHYVHNNPINMIDPTGMAADGWYEDKQGGIKYDKSINSQEDLDDKKIQGTFIDKSFVGIDHNNNRYDFQENGKVSLRNGDKEIETGSTVRSVQRTETILTSKSIRSFPSEEVASAIAISQADSPAPGPADLFASFALVQVAVSYFTNESQEQTIQVDFFAKSKPGKLVM